MTIPRTLPEQMADLYRRLGEAERRARNRKRTGEVAEIDLEKGLARVKLSSQSGKPFLTGPIPWKEISAGGTSSHIPPTVGQQVDVVSESGDLTDAVIDFSTHSNANPRPHNGPEAVIVHGGTRMTLGDGKVEIVGNVTIKGALTVEGNSVTHNGKNIGDTHTHGGVIKGGDDTDVPN